MEMRFSSGLADTTNPPTTTSREKNSKAGARTVFRAEILGLRCKTKSYISGKALSGEQAGTSTTPLGGIVHEDVVFVWSSASALREPLH